MNQMHMEVQVRLKCRACDGQGVVDSPAWAAWRQAYLDYESITRMTTLAIREFWHAFVAYKRLHPQPTEPEELPCRVCRGEGAEYRWVTLAQLLAGPVLAGG